MGQITGISVDSSYPARGREINLEAFESRVTKPGKLSKRAILLKGPSGTGKTFQCLSLVEAGYKVLYVRVGEHTGTLEDADLDCVSLELDKLDFPLAPKEMRDGSQDFVSLVKWLKGSAAGKYDFVYLDSLMVYADELLGYLKYSKGLSGYDLWGAFGEKMRLVLKNLVGLARQSDEKARVNVVATWGVEVSDNWEGRRAIVPIVDGKMVGPRIDYAFDDVFMLRKREGPEGVQYLMYAAGTHEFDAKVSSGKVRVPPIMVDPNLAKVFKLITTGAPAPGSKS